MSQCSLSTWIMLAAYGEHPHSKGIQEFYKEDAHQLIEAFKIYEKKTYFHVDRVPIYIGHPDDPDFAFHPDHQNKEPLGFVMNLDAREDGLWVLPYWSPGAYDLIQEGAYQYLSPRWSLIHNEAMDIYRPFKLISIGLTNKPNLKNNQVVEWFTEKELKELQSLKREKEKLECMLEKINAFMHQHPELSFLAEFSELFRLLESSKDTKQPEPFECKEKRALPKVKSVSRSLQSIKSANTALDAEDKAKPSSLNEKKVVYLKTSSAVHALKLEKQSGMHRKVFSELVQNRIALTGEDYSTAWSHVKHQHPEVYTQFTSRYS